MKKTYILITAFSAANFLHNSILQSPYKPTSGLTMLAIVISAMSLWKSVDIAEENSKQTEKSFKLTEITLEKNRNRTKKERHKRTTRSVLLSTQRLFSSWTHPHTVLATRCI